MMYGTGNPNAWSNGLSVKGLGMGMGDTTSTATSTTAGGTGTTALTYGAGLSLWTSPGTALSATGTLLSNPSQAFGSTGLMFTLGVLTVPLGLAFLLMGRGR